MKTSVVSEPKKVATSSASAGTFRQLLRPAVAPGPTSGGKSARALQLVGPAVAAPSKVPTRTRMPTAPMGVQTVLAEKRAHAVGETERLGVVRGAHHATAQTLVARNEEAAQNTPVDAKFLALLCQELEAGFSTPATPATAASQSPNQRLGAPTERPTERAPEGPATTQQKAQQAVALIEKIERFVKSTRPALALTLDNSLGARVEIERVGPREIALKLVGHRGPPPAEAVARIREEMANRGLTVRALSVA